MSGIKRHRVADSWPPSKSCNKKQKQPKDFTSGVRVPSGRAAEVFKQFKNPWKISSLTCKVYNSGLPSRRDLDYLKKEGYVHALIMDKDDPDYPDMMSSHNELMRVQADRASRGIINGINVETGRRLYCP